MRNFRLVVLILLGAFLPSWSQTTWKGIKFGSSINQVQQDLATADVTDLKIKQSALPMSMGGGPPSIGGQVSIEGIKLDAELLFNKTGRGLSQVGMFFEDNAHHGPTCATGSNGGHQIYVFRHISDALVKKYGTPSTSSRWPTEDQISYKMAANGPEIKAERIWRVEGQAIKQEVVFDCGAMFLTIIYLPISSEL